MPRRNSIPVWGLVVALGLGVPVAPVTADLANCKKCVEKGDIASGAVTKKKIKGDAIRSGKIKDGQVKTPDLAEEAVTTNKIAMGAVTTSEIADGAVSGAKIANDSIDHSRLADLSLFGNSVVRAPVSIQTDKNSVAAQAAAPKIPLFSKGQLSVYGKCFESDAFETFAAVSVETSAPGAILGANETVDPAPTAPGAGKTPSPIWLDGDPAFLDPGTAETDRTIGSANHGAGSLQSGDLVRVSFTAISPDGTTINGLISIAAGNGIGGVYGSENGCLFSGFVIG